MSSRPADPAAGPDRALSRRRLLTAAGIGTAGAALAGAPAALAKSPSSKKKPGAKKKPVTTSSQSTTLAKAALDVAATVEVLTTVVTTTALQKLQPELTTDALATVGAASREELDHYNVLTKQYGAKAQTQKVWVPDAVFADTTSLFTTLVVGEQICVNLYLVFTTLWAAAGSAELARVGAELVGNESVHRALARQALQLEPNDRAFALYGGVDQADGPGHGVKGFTSAPQAIAAFEKAGVGFGKQGTAPGAFYDFESTIGSTPSPSFVNTTTPS